MAPRFLKCYRDAGVQSEDFEDFATALDWVEARIKQSSERIASSDTYRIGDAAIDEQHQEIFMRGADGIAATTCDGQTMCSMRLHQDALTHFSHEESLMHRLRYAGFEQHLRQHLDLIAQLEVISRNIANDNLIKSDLEDFISHWLLTHIANEDKKLAAFLKS